MHSPGIAPTPVGLPLFARNATRTKMRHLTCHEDLPVGRPMFCDARRIIGFPWSSVVDALKPTHVSFFAA